MTTHTWKKTTSQKPNKNCHTCSHPINTSKYTYHCTACGIIVHKKCVKKLRTTTCSLNHQENEMNAQMKPRSQSLVVRDGMFDLELEEQKGKAGGKRKRKKRSKKRRESVGKDGKRGKSKGKKDKRAKTARVKKGSGEKGKRDLERKEKKKWRVSKCEKDVGNEESSSGSYVCEEKKVDKSGALSLKSSGIIFVGDIRISDNEAYLRDSFDSFDDMKYSITLLKQSKTTLTNTSEFASFDDLEYPDDDSVFDLEVQNFHRIFGDERLYVKPCLFEQSVFITFYPDEVLSRNTSRAWQINGDIPIHIEIRVTEPDMAHIPVIKVFQEEGLRRETTGALVQLQNIANEFTKRYYKERLYDPNCVEFLEYDDANNFFLKSLLEISDFLIDQNSDENTFDVEDNSLYMLLDMGFPLKLAKKALEVSDNDPDVAIQKLLSNEVDMEQEEDNSERLKPEHVDMKYGFLTGLFAYIMRRIQTLNRYCVVCDDLHLFTSSMIKPSVCSREICWWSFQELGVGKNASDSVACSKPVMSMLLVFAKAVSMSNRRNIVFNPFPSVFDPADSNTMILNPNTPNYALAHDLITKIPNIDTLGDDLHQAMDAVDPYCFPLFSWILESNRSYIVDLPENQRLPCFPRTQQFLLLSAPPEKEKKFQDLKKKTWIMLLLSRICY
eukprot:TRINITY_DN4268_c0_g1_i2.p1 TRINITY_DN4268_c0_g1~~TRINITY_DN4268_c0_g1_i2.p1  ORF type:complete len:686 (+),score=134.46 TRINITY_DN4268_c0_g1_i2:59-2059(+)